MENKVEVFLLIKKIMNDGTLITPHINTAFYISKASLHPPFHLLLQIPYE